MNVFISHAEEDTAQASALWRTLNEAGISPFSYKFNPPRPGTDFTQQIAAAIQRAHFIALLWGIDAATSQWVHREIAYASQCSKPIIPVVLSESLELPPTLSRTQAILAFKDPAGWTMQFRYCLQAPIQSSQTGLRGKKWSKWALGAGAFALVAAALRNGGDGEKKK